MSLIVLSAVQVANAADIKSGLQVGDFPAAFNVADVTGPAAGQELCYRCRYGEQPVVSVFARSLDSNVIKLIKDLDAVVGKNRDNRMAAFVVLLSDKPHSQHDELLKAAKEHGIQHTPLTIYQNAKGPMRYRIHEDADVTVVMWVESDVKANHAFRSADLNGEAIKTIVSDTQKILN